MLRLILFRHAQADRPAGVTDLDRPLSAKGRADARAMGKRAAEQGAPPDMVLVSPALRTRETWEIAAAAFGPLPVRLEPPLYETDTEGALRIVRGLDPSASSPMLVGHNPWMEELARLLVASTDRTGLKLLRRGMPTAAVAALQLPAERWSEIGPASARLEWFVAPER